MNDLIEIARSWVREHYRGSAEHLLKTEEWLRRIDPAASEAMLLAALTHDMERAFPGPDSPRQFPERGPDDPVYNQAHQERSARIVSAFLREQHAPESLVTEVAALIQVHEFGGWLEADEVQAADSLSFLEVNIDFFLRKAGAPGGWTLAQVRAKFDWMYERIKLPEARALATPLYEVALRKLRQKEEETGV
ncbi:MAG TPA: hypothetical protein VKV40_13400 [Ktedonobacteraceae bacterium]|nr:hypothetical protein [Ktedonobacteraceae bacterium]